MGTQAKMQPTKPTKMTILPGKLRSFHNAAILIIAIAFYLRYLSLFYFFSS